MAIQVEIPDNLIPDDEYDRLSELLGAVTSSDFEEAVRGCVLAAWAEYKEMFLGMGMPTRADEVQQHRLYFLIKHLFRGRLPTEVEVAQLFQLTQSRSRSLLQAVITRYHFALDEELENTLKDHIQSCKFEREHKEFRLTMYSASMRERLNAIIMRKAPHLPPVRLVRNTASTYSVPVDSYMVLCEHFEVEPIDPDGR